MRRQFLLERMTWPEAKMAFDHDPCVVVIPIGSTEQHGPHMPLGTDFMEAEAVAHRVGARADVIPSPTLPIGYAKYHTGFLGTLSVRENTLTQALIDICEDLVKCGATHIVFVSGHGGSLTALFQCGGFLRTICIPAAMGVYWHIIQTVNPEWMSTDHGDYIETSTVLAIDESLPRMTSPRAPRPRTWHLPSTSMDSTGPSSRMAGCWSATSCPTSPTPVYAGVPP